MRRVLQQPFSFRIETYSRRAGISPMSQPSSDRESLQTLLAKVHERLNEAGSVDTGSRELLGQVMGDIERALRQGGSAVSAAGDTRSAAVGGSTEAPTPRLEALAIRFEADHPALAANLRRLADLLGQAGI
jgi:Domain of unknown function (DUF4404)